MDLSSGATLKRWSVYFPMTQLSEPYLFKVQQVTGHIFASLPFGFMSPHIHVLMLRVSLLTHHTQSRLSSFLLCFSLIWKPVHSTSFLWSVSSVLSDAPCLLSGFLPSPADTGSLSALCSEWQQTRAAASLSQLPLQNPSSLPTCRLMRITTLLCTPWSHYEDNQRVLD